MIELTLQVFPLAIPFMAGPGAMARTMILVGQAGSDPRRLGVVFAMAVAVLAVQYVAAGVRGLLGAR